MYWQSIIIKTKIIFIGKSAEGHGRAMAYETSWHRSYGISAECKFGGLGAKRFWGWSWYRLVLRVLSQGVHLTW